MNKAKIGQFLRALRKEKNLTQDQLSAEFGCIYSVAAISKWEKGLSVPNIDDLKKLAKYYNVSVDEILNGTRYEEFNFEQRYFIFNNDWMSKYDPKDLYDIREEQELLIETRFKELLRKMVGDGLSLSEDKEFDFIVNNFYWIFLPAVECKDDYVYRNCGLNDCARLDDIKDCYYELLPGGLSDIKFEIYTSAALAHKATIVEKFWEANKKFVFIARQNIWTDINHVIEDREDELKERLNTIEDYEKDILLAAFQKVNVIDTVGCVDARGQELYEKQRGHKYDEEQLTKHAIKLLIESGAKLNKALLGYWRVVNLEHDIINKLENIHKNYNAPLLVPIFENGSYHYFTVDNTEKNRAKLNIEHENEAFDQTDYQELEKRLYAGEKTILKPYKDWVCGSGEWGAFLHARNQMLDMPLEEYIGSRDDKMTEELSNDLNSLSLKEIRDKYFPSEYKGEYMDDANSMSPEELKKKYYLKDAQ